MSVCCEDFSDVDAENIGSISNLDDSTDNATLQSFYEQLPHVGDPNASYSSFVAANSKDVNTSVIKGGGGRHRRSGSAAARSSSASVVQQRNNRSSSMSNVSMSRNSSFSGKSKLNDSKNVTFRRNTSVAKPKNKKQQQQKQQQYEHPLLPQTERLLKKFFNNTLKEVADEVAMADADPDALAYYGSVKAWAYKMYTEDQLFTATQLTIRELVQNQQLSVRPEADISADVGLQETVSQLLLQYHPNWLRLGLEIVLDREIPTVLHRQNFRKALDNYLFSNAQIREKYAGDCIVPSGEDEQKMKDEMWAHCLASLLVLVHFLDTLALSGQATKWRCLFVANLSATQQYQHTNAAVAPIKASKTVLQQLGSLIVDGRGDLPVYLNKHQIFVQYEQKPADEIDFTIRNLVRDMPDGLRFAQVIDLMSSPPTRLVYSLHANEDLSAIKRKANVEKVLARLQGDGLNVASLDAAKVANGDSNQVVRMAWMIAYHYGKSWMINPVRVYKQTYHIQESPVVVQPPQGNAITRKRTALDQALLMWALSIANKYGMQIKQLSTAFADGQLFCRIIHMYDPYLLDKELFVQPATKEPRGKQRFQNSAKTVDPIGARQRALQKACRAIGCIIEPPCDPKKAPSSQDVTMFLCALFDCVIRHTREVRAALVLQLFYRTIVKPVVEAKKPKRRSKSLALPRGGSSIDRGWSTSREPTIEIFYRERPSSGMLSDVSETVTSEVGNQDDQDASRGDATEGDNEDIDIPFLDASQIAEGDCDQTRDCDDDNDNLPQDGFEVEGNDNDVENPVPDMSQVAAEEVEDEALTDHENAADEEIVEAAETCLSPTDAIGIADSEGVHAEEDVVRGDVSRMTTGDFSWAAEETTTAALDTKHDEQLDEEFLTITSCREVMRRIHEIAPTAADVDGYELQAILQELQKSDLTVTDAILTMRRFGEIACMSTEACAMIATQPIYFDVLIRLICSRKRTLADIDIISHCVLVLTQVAAVTQDLTKSRAKKLIDIFGELLLSYYHFETIVQCCMGAAMRLYADCPKFARVCSKPKVIASFEQLAQAWDLREEALVIAESALGYPLPRVPTTIDVYKPTTPSLCTFVDGIESGVSTVRLFCEVIGNPTGRVQLMVEEVLPSIDEEHAPCAANNFPTQLVEEPDVYQPGAVTGIPLTPEANRSRCNDLYVSPSPASVRLSVATPGSRSNHVQQGGPSLADYCSSPSSDASEELEGGWKPEQAQQADDTSFLFEVTEQAAPQPSQLDQYLTTHDHDMHDSDVHFDHSSDEESELFIGLQPSSPCYE